MSEPILVLNCGSSSIKFALFDGSLEPLPRKPRWAGSVEAIGGPNPTLAVPGAAPVSLALDAREPYHAALMQVRDHVVRQTGGKPPAVLAHRLLLTPEAALENVTGAALVSQILERTPVPK